MKTSTLLTVDEISRKVRPVLRRHGVKRAGLFGSAARGQLRKRSDVDILVQLEHPVGLFDFIGIKLELEESLGRRVDLVEYDAIKPAIRDDVLSDEVPIL